MLRQIIHQCGGKLNLMYNQKRLMEFTNDFHNIRYLKRTNTKKYSIGTNVRHYCSDKDLDPEKDAELKEILKEIKSDFVAEDKNRPKENNLLYKNSAEVNTHEVANLWDRLSTVNFETFDKNNPRIIYDFSEEQARREEGSVEEVEEVQISLKDKIEFTRGETGVFDVEDLVSLLRKEKVKDIVVIKVPGKLKYCNEFMIVTCDSQRHLTAVTELVKKVYKCIKNKNDKFLNIEGRGSKWIAVDMDNIVVHFMLPCIREQMDLETLWCVGSAFDDKSRVSNFLDNSSKLTTFGN